MIRKLKQMRFNPFTVTRLCFIFTIALWSSCTGPTHHSLGVAESTNDSSQFAVTYKQSQKNISPLPFQKFESQTGWSFQVLKPSWIEIANKRTDQGIPVKTLVYEKDRKLRITFYETSISPSNIKETALLNAFAYLFKVDAIPADKLPATLGNQPQSGVILFKPPQDSLKHWGLLIHKDSDILFIHVESKNVLPKDSIGHIPDLVWNEENTGTTIAADSCKKSFHAAIENTLGLKSLEDSTWQIGFKHFQLALTLDTNNASYLVNCAAIFQLRKDNLGGIDFLSNHPKLLETSGELAGIMGTMYEELGRYQEEKFWTIKALELDPQNVEWLINLSDALWGLGERVHSKNVLLKKYSEKPEFRISVYLAQTLLGLEEYENAKQVLLSAHKNTPPSAISVEYYLRALVGLKDYENALEFINQLEPHFPSSSNNYLFKGIAEFYLKLYRQAAASTKIALDLDASNREAQQLSTQISALMGNRSNLILRQPIAPLKTKGSVLQAKKLLNDPDNQKMITQSPLTLITQNIVYSAPTKTNWKKTRHQFFYIRDAKKLIRLSELTYEINPGYSRFFVNQFRLYDTKGKIVEDEKVSDFYVTKSHNTTLNPANLLVHLPIKSRGGVEILEVIITEESQLPISEFPYLRYDNAYPFPILDCSFEILHPPKHLILSTFGEIKTDSLNDRLVIRMTEPVPALDDDFRLANDEVGTGFSLTPFTTWRDVGHNYQNLLRKEKMNLETDSVSVRVRERAQEVVESNRGISPVISLFRYVRDSIRYNNYEFSLQALVPEKCEKVLTDGYGDCKGHALLLMQLLKARSIEAHLCLVSLNHAGDIDQPSLHQFNHMIVHVPAQKGQPQYYLDPTEKDFAFRRSPLALEGKNVLIIDNENSKMATIPELDSAGEHKVEVFHKLKVDAAQMALGEDSLVLSGKVAGEFRSHMRSWNKNTKYENLLSWLAQSYPSFGEERFRVLNEQDADAPLIMVFKYKRKFPFKMGDQEFEHFPKLELSFLHFPKAQSRKAPVYFPHEIQISSEWTYNMPDGYAWKSLNLDRELSEHYLHWLLSISQPAPESIHIKQSWRIDAFVAMPDEYSKIQSEWDPILANSGLKLVISKR